MANSAVQHQDKKEELQDKKENGEKEDKKVGNPKEPMHFAKAGQKAGASTAEALTTPRHAQARARARALPKEKVKEEEEKQAKLEASLARRVAVGSAVGRTMLQIAPRVVPKARACPRTTWAPVQTESGQHR